MTFLKNIVEETIKDTDSFNYQYQKSCKNLLNQQLVLNFGDKFLSSFIDIFNAYYTDEKIVKQIYVEKSVKEDQLLDFLEIIKCVYDIYTQITAFGESADHFKSTLADH